MLQGKSNLKVKIIYFMLGLRFAASALGKLYKIKGNSLIKLFPLIFNSYLLLAMLTSYVITSNN